MSVLRPYQQKAIDSIVAHRAETNKQLASLATGTGKTIILTTLSRDHLVTYSKKVLVLAHTEELLVQAKEKFAMVAENLIVVIDQGTRRITEMEYRNAHVIVASVQTLGRKDTDRIKIYNPKDFAGVIIDEAHHGVSATYVRILEYFGLSKHPPEKESEFYEEYLAFKGSSKNDVEWPNGRNDWNKDCLLLGVTATPFRSKQGETLKFVFDKLVFKYDLIDAIKDGWLANIHSLVAQTRTDLSNVTIKNGDFNQKELAETINTEGRNQFIVETYLDQVKKGGSIVFAVDLEHNKALKKAFQRSGVEADYVDGTMPRSERQEILERFKTGNLPVLINVGVLTEGFDAPNIENVLLARPTKSMGLFLQMVGRGTRLSPGKDKCTIIDFVDNSSKHNPLTLKYILGIPEGDATVEKRDIEDLKHELEVLDEVGGSVLSSLSLSTDQMFATSMYQIIDKGLIVAVTNYIKENFLDRSKFTWLKIFENEWFLPFPNYQEFNTKAGKFKFYQSRLKLVESWEEWELHFEAVKMNKTKISQRIGTYRLISEIDARVEGLILDNGIEAIFLRKNQRWHKDPCSDSQRDFIMKLLGSYNGSKKMLVAKDDLGAISKGEAGLLINVLRYQLKL